MASVSSVGSSSSSIYGTRNVISGLASGIDTETLIENAVSGYQLKIQACNKSGPKWSGSRRPTAVLLQKCRPSPINIPRICPLQT